MKFSWDEKKAVENFKNHGVAFEEAQEVFFDPNAIDFFDSEHSTPRESRFAIIGFSSRRLLFVAYGELEDQENPSRPGDSERRNESLWHNHDCRGNHEQSLRTSIS